MMKLFRVLSDRLAAMFATHVALEFETQLLNLHADRQADLLQKAAELERQGLDSPAAQLRIQADSLSFERPLASVSATPFSVEHHEPATMKAPAIPEARRIAQPATTSPRRKKAAKRRPR